MLSPSATPSPGARLTVVYDDDVDGAAGALLAVLRRPAAPADDEPEPTGADDSEDEAA